MFIKSQANTLELQSDRQDIEAWKMLARAEIEYKHVRDLIFVGLYLSVIAKRIPVLILR